MKHYNFFDGIDNYFCIGTDFNEALSWVECCGLNPETNFSVSINEINKWFLTQRFWDVLTTFVREGKTVNRPMIQVAEYFQLVVSLSHTQHQWTELGAKLCKQFQLFTDARNQLNLLHSNPDMEQFYGAAIFAASVAYWENMMEATKKNLTLEKIYS